MEKIIYDVLKKFDECSYEAYVVGGYVRDKLKGIKSYDIDITTNARPREVVELFSSYDVTLGEYGNVSFEIEDFKFDITTFRKDIKYKNNRKPEKIVYIDSFDEDLLRRDFTINSICLDYDDCIIDLHDGKSDLKRGIIRTIGDADKKISEDSLRILRAIRFATIFKFRLDSNLKDAIIKHKDLLRDLSYERKRDELNKIFCSKYKKYGVKLLISLGLLDVLDLHDIKYVLATNDLIGMWSMITDVNYSFTKYEKDLIKNIRCLINENINDKYIQYKYGCYVLSIVSDLKGYNTKKIINNYNKLAIKDRSELCISADEICSILKKNPDSFLRDIYSDIERLVIDGKLINDNEVLSCYVKDHY